MAIISTLPSAQSDIQRMRHFYKSMGQINQYNHSHAVYTKATRFNIIDEGIIRDEGKDPSLRINHLLRRRLAFLHVVDSGKIKDFPGLLPRGIADDALLQELDVFEKLTALERRGAPKSEFLALLNNGRRPLAPLIKIPDCSLTHDTEEQLAGFIANGVPSIIRQYESVGEARLAMKLDLKAAEKLWAPLAGFYGYQELSGDIFQQSYRVNHPEIHDRVIANMADPVTNERIARTYHLAKVAARMVARALESYGVEAEVPVRKVKHPGKQMEKAYRFLLQDYEATPIDSRLCRSEFVTSRVSSFDFGRFNDMVAVRAIISRFNGMGIDQLIKDSGHAVEPGVENRQFDLNEIGRLLDVIRIPALKIAVKAIADVLTSLSILHPEPMGSFACGVEYKKKPNGYHGFHFDIRAQGKGGAILVPFEFQLRTSEWHYISERGGAAHFLLKGGDESGPIDGELIETLGNGYHDLLYGPDPSMPPSSRICPPCGKSG
ncbi:hypothetical protein L0Y65_02035 [Candidatus Micrarchaeota archaeon]|nr:hypothetical protein [Candidatus Micrarchaeota archaeon]